MIPSQTVFNAAYGEVAIIKFIVFGLTRSELEPAIYHTPGEHVNLFKIIS